MDKGDVMKTIIRAVMVTLFLLVLPVWVSAGAVDKKPKLILQITVDQLRGDLPSRYYDRLGKGGLRYFWTKAWSTTTRITPMQTPKPSLAMSLLLPALTRRLMG